MWFANFIFLLAVCAGCASVPHSAFKRPYDLNCSNCRIGVMADCDSEYLSRKIFNKAQIVPFTDGKRAVRSLLAEKIDGLVYDEHVLRLAQFHFPDRFEILEDPIDTDPSVIAVSAKRADLLEKVNGFIRHCRETGLYDEMFLRWCHDPERESDGAGDMPKLPEAEKDAPFIRVGTDADQIPNSYVDDSGELSGFDIEFIRRFAAASHVRLKMHIAPEKELLAMLSRGELDIVIDNLAKEPERNGILWSDGYIDSDIVMMVKIPDGK